MKTIGIVAEYNPFHSGHLWQIKEARKKLGEDCAVIVVMSGSFTQRGEPGIMDKWDRAKAALACGVNLIIELPFVFAANSAGRFADGSIKTLVSTGIVQNIVFGSECGDIDLLNQIADIIGNETSEYQIEIKKALDKGYSWPAARQAAVSSLVGAQKAETLNQSNNILAIEYLRVLNSLKNQRKPKAFTIVRHGQDYKDTLLPKEGILASASSIRKTIGETLGFTCSSPQRKQPDFADLIEKLSLHMPAESLAVMMDSFSAGRAPLMLDDLAPQIITMLRTMPENHLSAIAFMQEGLDRRLAEAAKRPNYKYGGRSDLNLLSEIQNKDMSLDQGRLSNLLKQADTKRFPRTRIQRALLAVLMQTYQDDSIFTDSEPQYLRILAFDKKGRHLLKLMRKYADLPIITRASDFIEFGKESKIYQQAAKDLQASDLWALAANQRCGVDFDTEVIMG